MMYILLIVILAFTLLLAVNLLVDLYLRNIGCRGEISRQCRIMDIYFKKRSAAIPDLFHVLSRHIKDKDPALGRLLYLRMQTREARKVKHRQRAETELSLLLAELFDMAGKYPALKSDADFWESQIQFLEMETELNRLKQQYNALLGKRCSFHSPSSHKYMPFETDSRLEDILRKLGLNGEPLPKKYFPFLTEK